MNKFILTIVFVVLFVTLGWLLVIPKFRDYNTNKVTGLETQKEIADSEQHFTKLSNMGRELQNYPNEVSLIDSALPSEFSQPPLYNFLEMSASQSGMALKEVSLIEDSVSGEKLTVGMKDNSVNVSVTGPYGSFKNFLKVIESSARIINIDNISLKQEQQTAEQKKKNENPLFTFSLDLKIYSY